MRWSRPRPKWPVDPLRVRFGSVADSADRSLGRSHVRVRYRDEPAPRLVALDLFARRCNDALRDGRSLDIDELLVAPVARQRHAGFFDQLTDWGPATGRARKPTRSA